MASKPALASLSRYSCSSSAPGTQPIHSSTLRRISEGTSPRTTTSETANRPPGLSTRNASASTRSLSPERLMTAVGDDDVHAVVRQRNMLDLALQEFDIAHASLGLVLTRECEHLVRHVKPI